MLDIADDPRKVHEHVVDIANCLGVVPVALDCVEHGFGVRDSHLPAQVGAVVLVLRTA